MTLLLVSSSSTFAASPLAGASDAQLNFKEMPKTMLELNQQLQKINANSGFPMEPPATRWGTFAEPRLLGTLEEVQAWARAADLTDLEYVRIPVALIEVHPKEIMAYLGEPIPPLPGSKDKRNSLGVLSNYSDECPVWMDKIPGLEGVVFPTVHHAVLYAMGKGNLPPGLQHDDFVRTMATIGLSEAHPTVMGYIDQKGAEAVPGLLDDDVLLDLVLQKLTCRKVRTLLFATAPRVLLNQGGFVMGMTPFEDEDGNAYLQGQNKLGKLWMALRSVLVETMRRDLLPKKAEAAHPTEPEKKETADLPTEAGNTDDPAVETEKVDTAAIAPPPPVPVPGANNQPPVDNKAAPAAAAAVEVPHNNEAPRAAVPVPPRPAPAPAARPASPAEAAAQDNKPVVPRAPSHGIPARASTEGTKGTEGSSSSRSRSSGSRSSSSVSSPRRTSSSGPDDEPAGRDLSVPAAPASSSSKPSPPVGGSSSVGSSGNRRDGGGGGGAGGSGRSRRAPGAPASHGEPGKPGSPPKAAPKNAASPAHAAATALIHVCALTLAIFFL